MEHNSPHDAVFTTYSRNLISYLSRKLKPKRVFRHESQEDLEQELTAFLLSRAHQFDPSRGSPNTFADRVIRSGIATMVRDRLRQKRAPEFDNVSLEKTYSASDEETPSMRNNLTEADLRRRHGDACHSKRAESIDAVWEILQSLPAEDQEICRLRMEGSDASVARELGISRRQVRQHLDRLRKRFEAGGFDRS
ncbi:MAG TPA: sigma-70 family RNA polymerase sigma factor [Phycisphaerae bacterium]|nr:sigma-70 family RNA polymerase sigma factor [Phycisphaerae bacterium]